MHGTGATALASKRRKTRLIPSREPNGRITREPEFPPAQVRRLRDAAMRGLRDPEWGTELGRLYLGGAITPAMYAAGKKWAELARSYQHAIGAFPVRSATVEPGIRSHTPDPDSDEGRKLAKRESDGAERFFAAHAALIGSDGMLIESLVRGLCEHDKPIIGLDDLGKVRTGLMRLVSHWDLTGTGKYGSRPMSDRHSG